MLRAGDRDGLADDADAHAERALDRLQMLVVVAEQLVEELVILELELDAFAGGRGTRHTGRVGARRAGRVGLVAGDVRIHGRLRVGPRGHPMIS